MAPEPVERPLRGIRILIAVPSLGLGGAERQAYLLARHLLRVEQADVELVSFGPNSALTRECDAAGVPYSFFEFRHSSGNRLEQLNDLRRLIALQRRRRTDVLLPYCMFQNIVCGLTWRAGGARVCIWNQRDEGRSRVEQWIERLTVRQIRCFVSNSQHGADFLTECLRVPAGRVHLVYNGVELPNAHPTTNDWRSQLGIPRGAFVACMVANLHGQKDHATLVTAWRHVVDQFPGSADPPHLLLAGAFRDQHSRLLQQVSTLSLERCVHFLGQVHDVHDLLRTVDLAVFSSYAEGLPNAVLEAMAHGLAVVATDYDGIREAVGPAGRPLLANPRDPLDLACRILTAAADPAFRVQIGLEGKRRVSELFTVDRMASEMTRLITAEWKRVSS